MRWATEGLVRTLVRDPARARFGYVEVMLGGDRLRMLRETVRHDSIHLFVREYRARHGADGFSLGKIDLACNVIIHSIATHAREDRMSELPAALDAMLVAVGACEPT